MRMRLLLGGLLAAFLVSAVSAQTVVRRFDGSSAEIGNFFIWGGYGRIDVSRALATPDTALTPGALFVGGTTELDGAVRVDGNVTFNGTTNLGLSAFGTGVEFEGATANAFETTLAFTDPTADRTVTVPDASGTVMLSSLAANAVDIVNSVTGASNALVFEGTADAQETSLTATDATADRTVTLADGSGTVMLSSLATNAPDAANSVTGASAGLVFEGTADGFETSLTATDPTADRTVTLPDASGNVALWANANTQDVNLVFEGTTADGFETTVTVTDPTADRTITVPDGSGAVVLSTLTTNAPDAANAVTGASNALVLEGATADGFETSITPTDPTADRTITIPNASGTLALLGVGADPGATCLAGQIFIDTDADTDTNCTTTAANSLCLCTASNTWTALENN